MLTPSLRAWKLLLAREKKRRGASVYQLAFTGLHNVAQHWWCAEYALQKSWANELGFFIAYVNDRLEAARTLRLTNVIPQCRDDMLDLCASLGPQHGAQMLAKTPSPTPDDDPMPVYPETTATPYEAGEQAEALYAERYPTRRWHWTWEDLVFVGVPDGITAEFVYEFKSAKSAFIARYSQPVANTQGDLYGLFWGRPKKRIDLLIQDSGERRTATIDVSCERAEETMTKFYRGARGAGTLPPAAWKCKCCEYRSSCRVLAVQAVR